MKLRNRKSETVRLRREVLSQSQQRHGRLKAYHTEPFTECSWPLCVRARAIANGERVPELDTNWYTNEGTAA